MHFVSPKPAATAIQFVSLMLSLGVLTGCQMAVGTASTAQVRIIDASPDAPTIDIYQAGTGLAHNLAFGTITSYIPISPGASIVTANTAGSRQVLTTAKTTYAVATQYTVLIGDAASNLQQTVLVDQNQPAPAGQIALRVLDQTTSLNNAVDVYLVPAGESLTIVKPIATGMFFGSNSGYLTVPAGTYAIELLPAGTVVSAATVPLYTGARATYASGVARTLLLLDQPMATTPGPQVVVADDFDPAESLN